ncbi:MAG: sporulation integral membrane protein YtvI [Clostridia bacterium]|nr:sporulation integral membrane protein YtvI [Clostridia bacterium]
MSPKDTLLFRRAAWVVLLAGFFLGLRWVFKYLFPVILPFLLAGLISLAVRPLVFKLAGRKPVARGVITGFLVLFFVGLLLFGIFKGCERGVTELGRLMEGLSREDSEISHILADVSGWMTSLSEHLPFLDRFSDHPAFDEFCVYLDGTVRAWAESALETMGQRIPAFLMSLVGRLPSVLIFLTTLLLSCYYLSAHPEKPGERLGNLLPESWRTVFYVWLVKLKKAVGGYIRAYVFLGTLTFVEMLLGLSLLKIPYAFLMAGIIALVDFLPLLGAGTVLIPWAVVLLLAGDGGGATGLLVLFGLHTLLRQIIEPRLVGKELGLSPLASLVAVYAGWQLMGVGGMLLAPLVALAGKELLQNKKDMGTRS